MHEVVNIRSPEMWRIISEHVDFKGKTVLDAGCGAGDLLIFASEAGAAQAMGIEGNLEVYQTLIGRLSKFAPDVEVVYEDLELAIPEMVDLLPRFDIALCTSVLPYIDDIDMLMWCLAELADVSLIECQYEGDGPGDYPGFVDDVDMRGFLSVYWNNVSKIGETHVDGRDTMRSIWMCS